MATKAANDNKMTTEVVKTMNDKADQRKRAKIEYAEETARVCEIFKDGRVMQSHPEYFAQDTMVSIVARVPAQVAENITANVQTKMRDKYPCLYSFCIGASAGILSTLIVMMAITMVW